MEPLQVRRILVPNRENPIVNRLNKTKVEKKPDLKAEKDDMLKQLRAKDQAAMQIKVCVHLLQRTAALHRLQLRECPYDHLADQFPHNREKKNSDRLRSGKRRSGRKTTRTTRCLPKRTWPRQAIKTGRRIGKTISCRSFGDIHEDYLRKR